MHFKSKSYASPKHRLTNLNNHPPPPRLKKKYSGNNLFFYAYYRYYYNISQGIYDASNRKGMVMMFLLVLLVYCYRSLYPVEKDEAFHTITPVNRDNNISPPSSSSSSSSSSPPFSVSSSYSSANDQSLSHRMRMTLFKDNSLNGGDLNYTNLHYDHVRNTATSRNQDKGSRKEDPNLTHLRESYKNMMISESPTVERNISHPGLKSLDTRLYLDRLLRVYVLPMEDQLKTFQEESTLYHYFMMGMYEHPFIELVNNMDEADVYLHMVLYTNISIDPFRNFQDKKNLYNKLVIIDENDYFDNVRHRVFDDGKYLAFFKRSFVQKMYSIPNLEMTRFQKYNDFKDFIKEEIDSDLEGESDRGVRKEKTELTQEEIEQDREEGIDSIEDEQDHVYKTKVEKKTRTNLLESFARPSLITPDTMEIGGTVDITATGTGTGNGGISAGRRISKDSNERNLSFSYWPFQHAFFPFTLGITDRYILGLWDNEGNTDEDKPETKASFFQTTTDSVSKTIISSPSNVSTYQSLLGRQPITENEKQQKPENEEEDQQGQKQQTERNHHLVDEELLPLYKIDDGKERDIDITCSLRAYHKPTFRGNREIVFNWLESYLEEEKQEMVKRRQKMTPQEQEIQQKKDSWNIWADHNNKILLERNEGTEIEEKHGRKLRIILGEVDMWNVGNRDKNSPRYLSTLKRSKIIVTASPGNWEGDFRLWEALASKALLFIDPIYTPVPYSFQDGEDLIVYDSTNKEDFWKKIHYYLDHPQEAQHIAMNGYLKAIKYHRYVNRVDYVFNTVDILLGGGRTREPYSMVESSVLKADDSINNYINKYNYNYNSNSNNIKEWLTASRYSVTGMYLKELMMHTGNAITVASI